MPQMHTFTTNDWYGYASATPFADGSEPLMGSFKADSSEGIVIVDAEGIFVEVYNEEGVTLQSWQSKMSKEEATIYAESIPSVTTMEVLYDCGLEIL